MTSAKWRFEGDYFTACNCDWGCPCNFNGAPPRVAASAGVCGTSSYADKHGAVARVKFSEEGCVG